MMIRSLVGTSVIIIIIHVDLEVFSLPPICLVCSVQRDSQCKGSHFSSERVLKLEGVGLSTGHVGRAFGLHRNGTSGRGTEEASHAACVV